MMKSFSPYSFVAGVMVGALFAGAWFLREPLAAMRSGSLPEEASRVPSAAQGSSAISVADQPAGDSVIVESVTVPPPGVWVAVREVIGGSLGNVLGAARVGGPRSQVVISLLRATEPGRAYAIELYRDDESGAFDPATFSVYVDFDTGARVVAYFTTVE